MTFVADDLTAWLIGLLADAGRKRLTTFVLGDEQDRALRQAATAAVKLVARELSPADDEAAVQLTTILNHVFSEPKLDGPAARRQTLLDALQAGIERQMTPLGDADLTGVGQSSADLLGTSAASLAGMLTMYLVREIVVRGARGGALAGLANQLNHDMTHLQGQRLEGMVAQLADGVQGVLGQQAGHDSPQWPHQVGVVPLKAGSFQDRSLASDLVKAFRKGSGAATPQVLSGPAGVGKTQLAASYARAAFEVGNIDLLVWASASSRSDVVSTYAQAAMAVDSGQDATIEQSAERFLAWLVTTRRRWLVVLDDLTEPSVLNGLWPLSTEFGRTLITTRRRDAALDSQGRHLIEVGVFSEVEARRYLTTALAHQAHLADDVTGVASDLGQLPLALAQAAAFMRDADIHCKEYRSLFADRRKKLDDLVPEPEALPDQHRATVAATVSLSVERANGARPKGLARPLLELASVFDSKGVPVTVFSVEAALNWLTAAFLTQDTAAFDGVDQSVVRRGLTTLRRLNLVNIHNDIVQVHSLVQRVLRESISHQHLGDLVWAAADALCSVWPEIERDTLIGSVLRANSAVLLSHSRSTLFAPDVHPLVLRALRSLAEVGDPAGAASEAEVILSEMERLHEPDSPALLGIRNDLASFYSMAGDSSSAIAAFRDLITRQTELLGADHIDSLHTRNNLAVALAEGGEVSTAVAMLQELISDMMRTLGRDHNETLRVRGNLAMWGGAENYSAVLSELQDLLAERQNILGPDHIDTLRTRNNLAKAMSKAGNHAESLARFESLIPDLRHVLGPDHPLTLTTLGNLATERGEGGDPDGAIVAFEQLLAEQNRVLGPEHNDTMTTRSNLAKWRGEAGDPIAAVAEFEDLLKDALRVYGPDHKTTLEIQTNLPYWRLKAGDRPGAVAAFEDLNAAQSRLLGPDHPDTLGVLSNLGRARGEAGDPVGAMTAFETLVATHERLQGADHEDALAARSNLASWRAEAGDLAGAADNFRRLLHDICRALGPNNPAARITCQNLGTIRRRLGDPAGEVNALQELLAIQSGELGPNHPQVLSTRNDLGSAQSMTGDAAGAAATFRELVTEVSRISGADSEFAFIVRGNLASAIADTGDLGGAITVFEQLTTDAIRILGSDHWITLTVRGNLARTLGEAGNREAAAEIFEQLYNDLLHSHGPDHPETKDALARIVRWRAS